MTKPGHEAPLYDKTNPADLTPHATEEQLRIGQDTTGTNDVQITSDTTRVSERVSGIQLTEKERAGVDRLIDQGLDSATATTYRTSVTKARQIIGHDYASRAAIGAGNDSEQRAVEEEARQAQQREQALEVLRSTLPKSKPETSTDSK